MNVQRRGKGKESDLCFYVFVLSTQKRLHIYSLGVTGKLNGVKSARNQEANCFPIFGDFLRGLITSPPIHASRRAPSRPVNSKA